MISDWIRDAARSGAGGRPRFANPPESGSARAGARTKYLRVLRIRSRTVEDEPFEDLFQLSTVEFPFVSQITRKLSVGLKKYIVNMMYYTFFVQMKKRFSPDNVL